MTSLRYFVISYDGMNSHIHLLLGTCIKAVTIEANIFFSKFDLERVPK